MTVMNNDTLIAAQTIFREAAEDVFASPAAGPWQAFTRLETGVDTITPSEALLGQFPTLVEMTAGSREGGAARAYSKATRLKTYTLDLPLQRKDVQYDRIGMLTRRIGQWLAMAANWYDKLATDALVSASGAGPNSYDAVGLIGTTHPHGPAGANQSNKGTSALTVTTLDTAIVAMQSLRGEYGEPLNIMPRTLVVGPKNAKTAMQLTGSTVPITATAASIYDAAASAVGVTSGPGYFGGFLDVMVSRRLIGTQDDYWYVCDPANPPIALFVGMEPVDDSVTDMADATVRNTDVFSFGLKLDAVADAVTWQGIYGAIL